MKWMAVLITGLATQLLLTPAFALEIIYPEDGTWFTKSNFLIIKGGSEPLLDGMVVEINGVKSDLIEVSAAEYRAAFGDLLILQPEFDAGKNRIAVEGYLAGKKVSEAKAQVYFLADPMAAEPDGYRRFLLHEPAKEKVCAPCHNMTPDKKELAVAGPQNPCASCHQRLLDKQHVHGPAGVWSCTYCHDPAAVPRYSVTASGSQLCTDCHEDKVTEFTANKFVHGPVEAGLCLVCHDPHATDNSDQLHYPVNRLCAGCHAEKLKDLHAVRGVGGQNHPLEGPRDPSRPGEPFTCASCHDPHGGAARQLFRFGAEISFQLCAKCHPK